MTKLERKAALAVAGAAAAVTVAGIRLLKRYAVYTSKRASAFFAEEEAADRDVKPSEQEV